MPLFVKAPGQMEGRGRREPRAQPRHGRDDRRPARDDASSTEQDGRSAFSREVAARARASRCARATSRGVVRIGLPELQARRAALAARAGRELFGTGAESALLYGDPWARAYRIGPHRELLDRPGERAAGGASGRPLSASDGRRRLRCSRTSRRRDRCFPTRVTGPLAGRARRASTATSRWPSTAASARRRPQLRLRRSERRVLLVPGARDGPPPGREPARAVRGAGRRNAGCASRSSSGP